MIKRGPQEIADFFQCYVAQDKDKYWFMYKDKPIRNNFRGIWVGSIEDPLGIPYKTVEIPANHHWTTLYEPQPYSEKSADFDNKEASYSEKAPVSENKPDHLGEVYTHKEFQLVYSDTPAGLSDAVTKLIGRGWSLYSSPFAMAYGAEYYLHQAMVRGV